MANRPTDPNVPGSQAKPQPIRNRDHSADLGLYGLPSDVAAQVDAIFRRYTNPTEAASAAIAYIRGTGWYAQTYPGITQARRLGFIGTDLGSERQYKQTYQAYNQLYKQYYGRDITNAEATNLFGAATDPNYLAKQLYGAAYVKTNRADIAQLAAYTEAGNADGGQFTKKQLAAYGQEVAGIDNPLGQKVQLALDKAQKKLSTLFTGQAATPNLSVSPVGLVAPGLGGQRPQSDVGA